MNSASFQIKVRALLKRLPPVDKECICLQGTHAHTHIYIYIATFSLTFVEKTAFVRSLSKTWKKNWGTTHFWTKKNMTFVNYIHVSKVMLHSNSGAVFFSFFPNLASWPLWLYIAKEVNNTATTTHKARRVGVGGVI